MILPRSHSEVLYRFTCSFLEWIFFCAKYMVSTSNWNLIFCMFFLQNLTTQLLLHVRNLPRQMFNATHAFKLWAIHSRPFSILFTKENLRLINYLYLIPTVMPLVAKNTRISLLNHIWYSKKKLNWNHALYLQSFFMCKAFLWIDKFNQNGFFFCAECTVLGHWSDSSSLHFLAGSKFSLHERRFSLH